MNKYNYEDMLCRIKQAMKEENLSVKKLANLANVPYGTLYKVFSGDTKEPSINLIIKTASVLNVTADKLIFGKEIVSNNNLSTNECNILKMYNSLDRFGKEVVENVLNLEHKRCSLIIKDNLEEEKGSLSFMKVIPLADVALSAGEGVEPLTDTAESIEIDSREYPQADIAFKVKGDSMEPRYSDGDIVYVHSQKTLDNGQIGAFLFNGEQYLKKYVIEDGKYILRSLNNKYKDIVISENDSFDVYGKVLN